jgi:SEC-C motif
MKIGRNDPCVCGSGKKYKRCCIDKPKEVHPPKAIPINKTVSNVFFQKYNTASLLQTFAGLSLLSENHGKYVRVEELARISIENFNNSNETPSAQVVKEFLDVEYPSHYLEDPPVNLFTDLVTFYGGDYLLFPGITENGSFILNNLLAAVFHWPDSGIPKQFVINCHHTVSLILAISNTIASRLKYKRYQEGTSEDEKIIVPNDDALNNLKAAVVFTTEEMKELCKEHHIAFEAVNDFLIDINSPDLSSPHVEESPLIYRPILKTDEQFIVVSPATLSLAITDYIWASAERSGCMEAVNEAYHSLLWNNLQMQLGPMKFKRIDVEGITLNIENHEREGLYCFDDDKIAYVQYLYDKGTNFKIKNSYTQGGFGKLGDKENHKKEIIAQFLAKPEFAGYEIFDFIILSPIGRDFMYPIMKAEHAKTIAIPMFELDVLWNLKDTKALDLWKFTIAREAQIPDAKMMNFSFLDQYRMYQDHHDSFYLSDERKYDSIHVQVGYSDDLIKQSKHKTDKHSALKNINGRIANVQVERKDKYAPIYVDLMGLLNSELEFLVEGFHQAVWVSPKLDLKELKGEIRNMFWQVNDAIAYWLWQIQDDIIVDLKQVGSKPLTVTFDLTPIEQFETIDRDFTRDLNLSDKFQTEATDDSLNIVIPGSIIPYLYGSDNEGERVLVKHLLLGFNKLLVANNQPSISEERILQIVERKAPLGMKKKFFILDTSDNLMLDTRNLKGHRYVQEYDTSVALNSIVPTLGTLCPPVGEIATQKERDNLSFKIVQNALLPILRSKIGQYDSTELLKRFISLNESLIRKREELRVHTPTRIACFVSVEQHQIDLQENLSDVNRTTIALRCLIEHVAAEPIKGNKRISIAAVDELVAIMDQVISWGSLSDQIHFNLFDVKMSILPTGRIGTEKTQIKEVFDPYYESKTKENVADAISTFEQVFPQNENLKGKDVPENLDKAFIVDYGISFTRICQFIEGLVHIGFLQSTPYASLPLAGLRDIINKYVTDFDEPEFESAIDYLTLTNRGKIEKLPKGYEFIDIMPWRFNRMLSFIRKPIVLVDAEVPGSDKMIYWGVRQLLSSRIYLADQFFSDRLRVFENSQVKRVLGKFAQQRGDSLVKKIVDSINPAGLIIDQDVYIGPGHSLKNDIDIGDVDVLVIDTNNKILFSLECKSMSPSRNIKEMIEEVEKLFGSQSEMGWVDKHVRRHDWLEANRQQINKKYKVDISDFKIKSVFITNEDMLTPYLRKQTLPIPFITSYEIENGGYESIFEL